MPVSIVEQTREDIVFSKQHMPVSENTYFVTITLKPKIYKFLTVTQFDITRLHLVEQLSKHTDKFILVPEVTKLGNIHYHAIIHNSRGIVSFINAIKKQYKNNIGFMKVTPNPLDNKESLDRAYEYLVKDLHVTSNYITNLPLSYDESFFAFNYPK